MNKNELNKRMNDLILEADLLDERLIKTNQSKDLLHMLLLIKKQNNLIEYLINKQ